MFVGFPCFPCLFYFFSLPTMCIFFHSRRKCVAVHSEFRRTTNQCTGTKCTSVQCDWKRHSSHQICFEFVCQCVQHCLGLRFRQCQRYDYIGRRWTHENVWHWSIDLVFFRHMQWVVGIDGLSGGGGPGGGGTKGRELNECIFTNSNWKKVPGYPWSQVLCRVWDVACVKSL